MFDAYSENTLVYDQARCSGCGMCGVVCPHSVFTVNGGPAVLSHRDRCMECGACSLNCPTGAIEVESGVGCAAALMYAALTGKDDSGACCGPWDDACDGAGSVDSDSGDACCEAGDRAGDSRRDSGGRSCCS